MRLMMRVLIGPRRGHDEEEEDEGQDGWVKNRLRGLCREEAKTVAHSWPLPLSLPPHLGLFLASSQPRPPSVFLLILASSGPHPLSLLLSVLANLKYFRCAVRP